MTAVPPSRSRGVPTMVPGPLQRTFQAQLPAHWSYIEPIRECLGKITALRFGDRTGERVRTITQELLENGVKYGEMPGVVEIELAHSNRLFEIAVTNQAIPSRLQQLRKYLQEANDGPADVAFARAMERAAGLPNGRAMLGLVRMRVEAEAELDCSVSDATVRMMVRGRIV